MATDGKTAQVIGSDHGFMSRSGNPVALVCPLYILEDLEYAYHHLHETQPVHRMEIDVELVNLRRTLFGEIPAFDLPEWKPIEARLARFTNVYVLEEPVAVMSRNALRAGNGIDGPATITETASAPWIDVGWQAIVGCALEGAMTNESYYRRQAIFIYHRPLFLISVRFDENQILHNHHSQGGQNGTLNSLPVNHIIYNFAMLC